ncbi:hypothetical protein CC80DRAFT_427767 [Byssothecium circinans]|uniref:Uncharacterized protein n=1 Tax=Byssothecium circinans TaxID=147558 RepID=A0A6A5TB93_9PLEO|nr:hypothetical protein CC80DRAFT_427767 [Byssothecium circinans]
MDNERRPRHNPGYASQQQGALLQPQQASFPVVSASDRFRQAPLAATAVSASAPAQSQAQSQPQSQAGSGGRAGSTSSYGYAYGEASQFVAPGIQQQAGVSYGAQDYGAEQQAPHAHSHSQRASQQFPQYGQNVLYSVAGAQVSAAGASQYEPVPVQVQQYQQNRDSAIEVLGTSFGVAQPQYYGAVPSEGGPTSAPAPSIATQNVPSQYPSLGYTAQPAPVGRESLAPAYTQAGMTDPHQPTAPGGYQQPAYGEQQHSGSASGSANEYDDFYNNYQSELKRTFEFIRDDRLSDAAQQLFRLSDWLLHWAETLGLVRDDENHYQQRLKLWEEFNHGWLSLLQKQTELVQKAAATGQRPQPPQQLIEYDYLEKMGTQLVKNCDNMEKHGLVDYQMGVWEEEIIAMLTACLDQLDEMGAGSGSAQRPSASSSRRR